MSAEPVTTPPPFGTQIIGQTEKALNAILDRQLAGTGLSEPQWVALTIAVISGDPLDRASFVARIAGALKISDPEAHDLILALASAGMLDAPEADRQPIAVTEVGSDLHARIRAAVVEITERLWGDLPADELATASRVLATVLARANTELSDNGAPY